MNQPRISKLRSWEKYKGEIFQAIREGLIHLQSSENLPQIEDSFKSQKANLNRRLLQCIRDLGLRCPIPNAPNPVGEGEQPDKSEGKIPDFTWDLQDDLGNGRYHQRRFIAECKRLGGKGFQEKYVHEGLKRFLSREHEYGKDIDTCAMIGYIQSGDFDEIWVEVNAEAKKGTEVIPPLNLASNGWQKNGVSELDHELKRPFPITPFRLHHFWVDLREKYQQTH